MWYMANFSQWLDEIISKCKERNVDPINSTFMIASFTSLDAKLLEFFKENYAAINSYTDRYFHVLAPLIYENRTVSDDEIRELRKQFQDMGLRITNRPCFLIFRLIKTEEIGLKPHFFAAFEVTDVRADDYSYILRDIVDECLAEKEISKLTIRLELLMQQPNILRDDSLASSNVEIVQTVKKKFSSPRVFISYSHNDTAFVHRLRKALSKAANFWIDEKEINIGDELLEKILEGIRICDYMLPILSPSSINKEWVRFEISQFIAKEHKKFFPVYIQNAKPQDLPDPLKSLQNLVYADFSNLDTWDENIKKLKTALRE